MPRNVRPNEVNMTYLFVIFGCVIIWGVVAILAMFFIGRAIDRANEEDAAYEETRRNLRHWRHT